VAGGACPAGEFVTGVADGKLVCAKPAGGGGGPGTFVEVLDREGAPVPLEGPRLVALVEDTGQARAIPLSGTLGIGQRLVATTEPGAVAPGAAVRAIGDDAVPTSLFQGTTIALFDRFDRRIDLVGIGGAPLSWEFWPSSIETVRDQPGSSVGRFPDSRDTDVVDEDLRLMAPSPGAANG
jgi:hypothetical protein